MPTPREIADRDRRLLELHDRLAAEWGRPPTRQELADEAGDGVSRGQVQAAFFRARQRGEKGRDRAPGAGRPAKPREPLLDVVVALCEQALAAVAEYEGLPAGLTSAARKLRGRKGWQGRLRDREAEPLSPEQLELLLDPLTATKKQIPEIEAALDRAATDTERRQLWAVHKDYMQLLSRLQPPEERDGTLVTRGAMAEHARGGYDKLAAAAARLAEEQADRRRQQLEQLRAEGLLDVPEARQALRLVGWLPRAEG